MEFLLFPKFKIPSKFLNFIKLKILTLQIKCFLPEYRSNWMETGRKLSFFCTWYGYWSYHQGQVTTMRLIQRLNFEFKRGYTVSEFSEEADIVSSNLSSFVSHRILLFHWIFCNIYNNFLCITGHKQYSLRIWCGYWYYYQG